MSNRNLKLTSIIVSIFIHISILFVQLNFNNSRLPENECNYEVNFVALNLNKELIVPEKSIEENSTGIDNNKEIQTDFVDGKISKVDKQQFKNKIVTKEGVNENSKDIIKGSKNDKNTNTIIDNRGIYEKGEKIDKTTAAMLNIEGWEWDSLPIVKDSSDFIGKIVFEIIIDKFGFITGIKEIEKTIPPDIAIKYKEALLDSTFKSLDSTEMDKITTTGTVTFIITC